MKRLLVLLVVSLVNGLVFASQYPAVVSNAYIVARNAGVYVNVFCTNESLYNGEELNFEMALLRNDIRQVMGCGPCYLDVNPGGRCGSSANVIETNTWHTFKVMCDTHFRVSIDGKTFRTFYGKKTKDSFLLLGMYNMPKNRFYAALRRVWVEKDDEIIRDYRPCKLDGVTVMFDVINKKYAIVGRMSNDQKLEYGIGNPW